MHNKTQLDNERSLQMNKEPKVSVCMAMYNASRYLRECIDSILAQTFTDFELLIVDDGSEDDSVSIIESYDDTRIRLIRNQHDYIGSLNILLDEAKGKYIARMDADDVMISERLQLQYDYMESHTSIDLVASGMNYIGSTKQTYEPDITNRCLYPLCFGGCSQKLLNNHDKCSRNLDNNGITEVIRQRILFLTGNINKQKK